MIDKGKKNLLGIGVDAVDYDSAVAKIISAAHAKQRMAVSALAVHGVMTGVLDKEHQRRLNSFELIVPDGQPVRWSLNLLYNTHLPDRVYGPILTLRVCEKAAEEGLPIYLYGSKHVVLQRLIKNLTERFPHLKIAGARPSLFRQTTTEEKAEIIETIRDSGARIVLVGLGCPRQEVWVYEYSDYLSIPIIAVGAAFDFHAGTVPQAPSLLQKFGLEWLFRLVVEPRRLWRRYLLLNPLFLFLLLLQLTRLYTREIPSGAFPVRELRYG